MRRREDLKTEHSDFLHKAMSEKRDEIGDVEDFHKYVRPFDWPISKDPVSPSLADGSATLNKNLSVYLKEKEWNSIDRHVKALDRNKSEWIRYALLRLMQEEQIHCFKNRKNEKR
ncbi:MAG: hypothetical protein LBB21_04035 [Holosporaceae bacterium]|jgi:hypothetical protein|nr:hypothetical protein [Holosporaceae bacterium]